MRITPCFDVVGVPAQQLLLSPSGTEADLWRGEQAAPHVAVDRGPAQSNAVIDGLGIEQRHRSPSKSFLN
jgi:hypothetical protein